jgi:DNA relaxase NicK
MYPDPPGRGFFREFSDASDALSLACGRQGRPWYVALLDEYGRGDTCYIGARSSENFGRIYDKGRESPEQYALGSVRFETEHKGTSAARLFEQLLDDSVEPSSFACGYVAAFFESRGVQLPIDVNAVDLLSSLRAETDADRQLRWLRTGVMPTVARLVKVGRSADVRQMLLDAGLDF